VGERYYDPATGKWVSRDPLGVEAGDSNLYRYAGNDPANAKDPSGRRSDWAGLVCSDAPKETKLEFDTVTGPTAYRNGELHWSIRWLLTKNAGAKGGVILQRIVFTFDLAIEKPGTKEFQKLDTDHLYYYKGNNRGKKVYGTINSLAFTRTDSPVKMEYWEAWKVKAEEAKPASEKTFELPDPRNKEQQVNDIFSMFPLRGKQKRKDNTTVFSGAVNGTITVVGEAYYLNNVPWTEVEKDFRTTVVGSPSGGLPVTFARDGRAAQRRYKALQGVTESRLVKRVFEVRFPYGKPALVNHPPDGQLFLGPIGTVIQPKKQK
jgi:hypothetical protein